MGSEANLLVDVWGGYRIDFSEERKDVYIMEKYARSQMVESDGMLAFVY